MKSFVIASLSLLILAEAVTANGLYQYVRECNNNTEICINLKCSESQQVPAKVPFTYHYSCCNGKLIDEKNYACVRYKLIHGNVIVTTGCDPCSKTAFRCNDGQCTFKQWKCNGVKDCMDGSDEFGCGSCPVGAFHCKRSDKCISNSSVCDKVKDCPFGSDETGCPKLNGAKCGVGKYRCKNDRCIPGSWVCDGENDCGDRSDEARNCPTPGGKRSDISLRLERKLFKKNGDVGGNKVDDARGTIVG